MKKADFENDGGDQQDDPQLDSCATGDHMMSTARSITSNDHTLTSKERRALLAYESTIEAGKEAFLQVGAALLAIRDDRLYRQDFGSFEEYVEERWGFSRQRAYQLLTAAEVALNLSTTVDIKGLNERQARELTQLSKDDQVVVYRLAKSTAPAGRVTARHLENLATVAQGIMEAGAIDDTTGIMVPWDALTPERKATLIQANLDEEGYERWQRQHAHVVRVAMSSGSYEWYTPKKYVEAAREVMGGIDLDPASSEIANQTVGAKTYYTLDDDGLTHGWKGKTWANPPYSSLAPIFVAHLIAEFAAGRVTAAIILLNAHNTDTQWFQPLWDFPCCFTNHRISFINGDDGEPRSGNNHGSAFFYLGPDVARFEKVFGKFGTVVGTRRAWDRGVTE